MVKLSFIQTNLVKTLLVLTCFKIYGDKFDFNPKNWFGFKLGSCK